MWEGIEPKSITMECSPIGGGVPVGIPFFPPFEGKGTWSLAKSSIFWPSSSSFPLKAKGNWIHMNYSLTPHSNNRTNTYGYGLTNWPCPISIWASYSLSLLYYFSCKLLSLVRCSTLSHLSLLVVGFLCLWHKREEVSWFSCWSMVQPFR